MTQACYASILGSEKIRTPFGNKSEHHLAQDIEDNKDQGRRPVTRRREREKKRERDSEREVRKRREGVRQRQRQGGQNARPR